MVENRFFETIKCDDYKVFNLEYHKKRMANTVGKNFSLEEYIYPNSHELLKCKVIYTSNDIIDISYDKYTAKNITSFKLIYDDNIDYSFKSFNREDINSLLLKKESADEIIIIKNGLLTDTSIANIAIYLDDVWITPIKPLLHGTTKNRYIDNNILIQKDITVEMLLRSKKIALLNAMIDLKILDNFDIIQ
ncbi:MAG TPA: branched-chain amino acid aminotransferase [Arcobacter sp.]|nr:branched-chain amino acid aminotransferase [Arcobacter sp.]